MTATINENIYYKVIQFVNCTSSYSIHDRLTQSDQTALLLFQILILYVLYVGCSTTNFVKSWWHFLPTFFTSWTQQRSLYFSPKNTALNISLPQILENFVAHLSKYILYDDDDGISSVSLDGSFDGGSDDETSYENPVLSIRAELIINTTTRQTLLNLAIIWPEILVCW